jgi:hypothetical protein
MHDIYDFQRLKQQMIAKLERRMKKLLRFFKAAFRHKIFAKNLYALMTATRIITVKQQPDGNFKYRLSQERYVSLDDQNLLVELTNTGIVVYNHIATRSEKASSGQFHGETCTSGYNESTYVVVYDRTPYLEGDIG